MKKYLIIVIVFIIVITGLTIRSIASSSLPKQNSSVGKASEMNRLVMVDIVSDKFVISNNTENVVFPEEILGTIEWSPCSSLKKCTDKINPEGNVQLSLSRFVQDDTESLRVFWWNLTMNDGTGGYYVENLQNKTIELMN